MNLPTIINSQILPELSPELEDYLDGFTESLGRYLNAPEQTQDIIDQAADAIDIIETSLIPADASRAGYWLAELGTLTASKADTTEGIARKISVYADMLEQPKWCFTKETLRLAATKFSWFPTFAEVNEFFNKMTAKHRWVLLKLKHVAETPRRRYANDGPTRLAGYAHKIIDENKKNNKPSM